MRINEILERIPRYFVLQKGLCHGTLSWSSWKPVVAGGGPKLSLASNEKHQAQCEKTRCERTFPEILIVSTVSNFRNEEVKSEEVVYSNILRMDEFVRFVMTSHGHLGKSFLRNRYT